jgi:fructose-bisphosphate aldolase, class I
VFNSGCESQGNQDLKESVRTAIINKRAGGMGLILGRKSFQKSFSEGVKLLHTIQDVYRENQIDIA